MRIMLVKSWKGGKVRKTWRQEGRAGVRVLKVLQDGRQQLDGRGSCEAWSGDGTHLVEGTVCHGLRVY
jgi:hypothetical protein